jgi:hypothetical protein
MLAQRAVSRRLTPSAAVPTLITVSSQHPHAWLHLWALAMDLTHHPPTHPPRPALPCRSMFDFLDSKRTSMKVVSATAKVGPGGARAMVPAATHTAPAALLLRCCLHCSTACPPASPPSPGLPCAERRPLGAWSPLLQLGHTPQEDFPAAVVEAMVPWLSGESDA